MSSKESTDYYWKCVAHWVLILLTGGLGIWILNSIPAEAKSTSEVIGNVFVLLGVAAFGVFEFVNAITCYDAYQKWKIQEEDGRIRKPYTLEQAFRENRKKEVNEMGERKTNEALEQSEHSVYFDGHQDGGLVVVSSNKPMRRVQIMIQNGKKMIFGYKIDEDE